MTRRQVPEWWLMALAGWNARSGAERWLTGSWHAAATTIVWWATAATVLFALVQWLRGNDYRFQQDPQPRSRYLAKCPDCLAVFRSVNAAEAHVYEPGACLADSSFEGVLPPAGLTALFERTRYSRWLYRDPIGAWLALVAAVIAVVSLGAALAAGSLDSHDWMLIGVGLVFGFVARASWRRVRG